MTVKRNTFTLIEIVLAIAVFTMIALLISSILYSVQRSWSNIRKHSARLDAFRKIDRIADCAFRNTIPFKWIDENLKERQIFRGDPDYVILAYLHRVNSVEAGGIRFLKLSLREGKLIAEYRKTPILYWLGQPLKERVEQEILADDVKSVTFEYADREGDEIVWYEDWDEEKKDQAPLALQMTLEFGNGSKERWLRRTAGSSYNSSLGKRDYSNK